MTKIKICGLTRQEDVIAVNEAGADYAGFVFADKSPRRITVERARMLKGMLDDGVGAVGVFADDDPAKIADLLNSGVIDIAQLHGQEDDSYVIKLKEMTGKAVIKAFEIRSGEDIGKAVCSSADFIMLDGGSGGCGTPVDRELLSSVNISRPFILAGGLDPVNVGAAVKLTGPFAVDVSSGVESGGLKDPKKIREFADSVRSADRGRFGKFGGQYVPETLMSALNELEQAYDALKDDQGFKDELNNLLNEYAGRPSLLYYAKNMTDDLGGAKIYLKREDLNHTGAHKINNVLGQALLAKRMGKKRLIAETGAGQHGVATATAAALMGMSCTVYMGEEDTKRQKLNVYRMQLLGAEVVPVLTGTATLKDAVSQTMREWTSSVKDTHYCLGSVMGPHPFPTIVRDFQAVISLEIKEQIIRAEGRLPDAVIACVGGGSNAIGSFYHFIGDPGVRLIGCEAAGRGVDSVDTAATLATGSMGIFHGMKSYFCQDALGQIAPVYSISAGLDYPGIGPEHAFLRDSGRADYVAVTDDEAVGAFEYLSRKEGVIPAIESAHAVAYAMKIAPSMSRDKILVVNLSGRGDKDCASVAGYRGVNVNE